MRQSYRRTTRGNYLVSIQGGGLGTGIATGQLKLVQKETVPDGKQCEVSLWDAIAKRLKVV